MGSAGGGASISSPGVVTRAATWRCSAALVAMRATKAAVPARATKGNAGSPGTSAKEPSTPETTHMARGWAPSWLEVISKAVWL